MKRILIVDDDLLNQKIISRILKAANFSTDLVSDGKSALNLIEEQFYDLIISDIYMPFLNGIQLIEKLNETNNKVAIIFMSGEANSEIKEKVLSLGAADYFVKPINLEMFVNRIKQILNC